MRPSLYHTKKKNTEEKIAEIQFSEIPKYKLQKYRNTNNMNTNTEIQIKKCTNTSYRITEIQVIQKFTHNSNASHSSYLIKNKYSKAYP